MQEYLEAAAPERNWGTEEARQPVPAADDTVLYSEHGRVLNKTDFRSHSFKLVKPKFGPFTILVRHGGGDQRVSLGYGHRGIEVIFSQLDSDSRYLLMSNLLDVYNDARRDAAKETAAEYRHAFAEGRLKKRKMPKSKTVKVWIE